MNISMSFPLGFWHLQSSHLNLEIVVASYPAPQDMILGSLELEINHPSKCALTVKSPHQFVYTHVKISNLLVLFGA